MDENASYETAAESICRNVRKPIRYERGAADYIDEKEITDVELDEENHS
jgi:hypothetical protein